MNKKLALIALVPFALQADFSMPTDIVPVHFHAVLDSETAAGDRVADAVLIVAKGFAKERLRKKIHEFADKIDAKAFNEKDLLAFIKEGVITSQDVARLGADVAAECITEASLDILQNRNTFVGRSLRTCSPKELAQKVATRVLVSLTKKGLDCANTKGVKRFFGIDCDPVKTVLDIKDDKEETEALDHLLKDTATGVVDLVLNDVYAHVVNHLFAS